MSKHKAKPPIPQKSAAVVARASVNAACHLANIVNCSSRSTRMSHNSASLIKQRISQFEGKNSNFKQVPEPVTIRKNVACSSDVRRPRTVHAAAATSDVAILSAAKASSKRQSVAMLSESKIFHQRYSMFETNIRNESQVLFNSRLKNIDCCVARFYYA